MKRFSNDYSGKSYFSVFIIFVNLHTFVSKTVSCIFETLLDRPLLAIIFLIDKYSRYPEDEMIITTSTIVVISKLDTIFSRQDIPETVKMENANSRV